MKFVLSVIASLFGMAYGEMQLFKESQTQLSEQTCVKKAIFYDRVCKDYPMHE